MKRLFTSVGTVVLWTMLLACEDHRPAQQITCDEYHARVSRCLTWRLVSKLRNNQEAILPCEKDNRFLFQTGRLGGQVTTSTSCPGGPLGGSHRCENGTVTVFQSRYNSGFGPPPGVLSQSLEFIDTQTFLLKYQDFNGDQVVETYVCFKE
ncbi:hypothetical protein DYU11_09780 [Fibrisoma montanum]|uniref:Lipocalin-like domain-containing protein n=1 Tax=Fibrisoma montanum TaxID=2305895 RepID=A0A418MFL0_9BACT|nr:hypothetical protein [Fibrisoma montanum]RIV25572.1 hypothetical protein DYU11_09780 [Fibrisoma montanum]